MKNKNKKIKKKTNKKKKNVIITNNNYHHTILFTRKKKSINQSTTIRLVLQKYINKKYNNKIYGWKNNITVSALLAGTVYWATNNIKCRDSSTNYNIYYVNRIKLCNSSNGVYLLRRTLDHRTSALDRWDKHTRFSVICWWFAVLADTDGNNGRWRRRSGSHRPVACMGGKRAPP